MRKPIQIAAALVLIAPLRADVAPLDEKKLADRAERIVVGTVTRLEITSEHARFEKGHGNYDWRIELTLRVNATEKGEPPEGDAVTARAFRIKSRLKSSGFLSPGGHDPIPGVGTVVRAYLDDAGSAILPNGFASLDDRIALVNAPEVRALKSGYTYGLPLGGWILVIAVLAGLMLFFMLVRKTQQSERTTVHIRDKRS